MFNYFLESLGGQSIKRKLIVISIMISSITIISAGITMLVVGVLNSKENLVNTIGITAEIIGNQSAAAIEFQDMSAAEENLRAARTSSSIRLICLYDEIGQEFAHYIPDSPQSGTMSGDQISCPPVQKGQDHFSWSSFESFHRIYAGEEEIGTVYIRASLEGLYASIREQSLYIGFIVLVAIVIAYMLFSRFQRLITEPIINLAQTARNLAYSKDYSIRVEKTSDDEMGALADSFNEMLKEMQQRDGELVTAKSAAEEAMEKADIANKLKGEFLANMSHEIRTPMNGIIGMTELLLESSLTHKQQNYARTVINSADSLLEIINDILDFSKVESGKLELEAIPFDLLTVVEDTSDLLAVKAREKAVELIVRYVPGTPKNLIGDPGRIRQIINNLAGNAIKFTEKGYVMIKVEEDHLPVPDGSAKKRLRISITDTGIGIPKEVQTLIFEKFSQADNSTTRQFGGTGLGLAISQQLTELMEGEIGVVSTPGQGSTFHFTMLLENDFGDGKVIPSAENLRGLRVLVVDDIAVNGELLKERLHTMGMECKFCSNGMEALALLREAAANNTPFHIGILDYLMPEMSGETLAQEIRSDDLIRDIALVMLTGAGEAGYSRRFREAGFNAYIAKPLRAYEFGAILSLCWERYKSGLSNEMVTSNSLSLGRAQRKKHSNLKFDSPVILLAEDNRVNQNLAIEILEQAGCRVDVVINGKQAINAVRENKFDLILMDCEMPEMDGFEASRILAEWKREKTIYDVPIVALTGNAMDGDKERCLAAGMQDYLSKPIRKGHMLEAIAKWLPEHVVGDEAEIYHFGGYSVLLVEDNRINRVMAEDMLGGIGFSVTSAENGRVAVDKVKHENFDLILMDCQMPEMDGYEATKAIKNLYSLGLITDTPIIALTANAMKGDREKCLEAGMDDYITKPVKQDMLQATIAKWLTPILDDKSEIQGHEAATIDYDIFNIYKDVMGSEHVASIEMYLNVMGKLVGEISRAYSENNIEDMATLSHALKFTSGALGIAELSNIARNMEEEVRAQISSGGKTTNIPQHIVKRLEQGFEEASILLQNNLNKVSGPEKETVMEKHFDVSALNMEDMQETKRILNTRYPEMVEGFLEDVIGYISGIEEGISEGIMDKIINNAHPLKSSSAVLGLAGVSQISGAMEEAARMAQSIGEISALFEPLKEAMVFAEAKLREQLEDAA